YDFQQGFERSRVILADSATLAMTPDRGHLYLTLHHGELFENLREATGMTASAARNQLYRREMFTRKELLIAFDASFER
ncbi:YjgP/YjgQ family permease, partial [Xanthomonas citri pv. citri]|nr:YjgP/YjgQ family permease [Xanthomonas citri pv. citri]